MWKAQAPVTMRTLTVPGMGAGEKWLHTDTVTAYRFGSESVSHTAWRPCQSVQAHGVLLQMFRFCATKGEKSFQKK